MSEQEFSEHRDITELSIDEAERRIREDLHTGGALARTRLTGYVSPYCLELMMPNKQS